MMRPAKIDNGHEKIGVLAGSTRPTVGLLPLLYSYGEKSSRTFSYTRTHALSVFFSFFFFFFFFVSFVMDI